MKSKALLMSILFIFLISFGCITEVSDADDTNINSPTNGQYLVYNGSEWINSDLDINFDDVNGMANPAIMDLNMNGYDVIDIDTIKFLTSDGGQVNWNGTYFTIDINTGLGATNQVGQEIYTIIYNDSGSEIANGTVVQLTGLAGGYPSVTPAIADTHEDIQGAILVTTMTIPNESVGVATNFGRVQGIDTSGFSFAGVSLWVSADVAGELTDVRPEFPDYAYNVGAVEVKDAVNGVLSIQINSSVSDTFNNFWNGIFRESINFTVDTNADGVFGFLAPDNGHSDMTMVFSDSLNLFDTSPTASIQLTPGTDDIPQINYVYVPKSTKQLTVSTSSFPTSVEHIKVATIVLRSASTTGTDGALRNQNWNDHVQSTTSNQGHLSHITERIRQEPSKWFSGTEGTVSIDSAPSPDDVFVSVTGGQVYQLHLQDFPAIDLNDGGDIHIVNDPVSPYETISNLNSETVDSTGATLSNKHFSFVVWGVMNRTGQASHIMLNLPACSYLSSANAISDASNCSDYSIPSAFNGVGFLIARFTFNLSSSGGGTWTLNDTQDLRGKVPNSTAGVSGGGGSGATTFLALTDTPSAYTSVADYLVTVNGAENALEFTPPIVDTNIFEYGLIDADTNSWLIDVNGGGNNLINFDDGNFDGNVVANSFRAGYEQTITASEQTITQTGQNTVALTLGGAFNNYVVGSTNPVFNDGTQVGQVIVAKVIDFGFPYNTLTMKDDSANGKVNLQGDKTFTASQEDVLIVMWDGSLWQEVYRNLGYGNEFTGTGSGWGSGNEFSGGNAGWGSSNDFIGAQAGWGSSNVFSGGSSGWGQQNEFTGINAGWGRDNHFYGDRAGWGEDNELLGTYSGWGLGNVSNAYQASFGRYSTNQGSTSAWTATDDLFKIGIGTGTGARADAFRLLKNGESYWETDQNHFFGLSNDVRFIFNGSDWIFDSENITANDEVHFTNFDKYTFDNDVITTGYLTTGSNTETGLSAGDINASTIYYDTLTAKSPSFDCDASDGWCSVSFKKHRKTLWLQRDVNWNILEFYFDDVSYTPQEFNQQVCPTNATTQNICDRLIEKTQRLQAKVQQDILIEIAKEEEQALINNCLDNNYSWDGSCFEIVRTLANYEIAVGVRSMDVMVNESYTCTELDKNLIVIEKTCFRQVASGKTVEEYYFIDNCGWDNNYYCDIRVDRS